jgi:DNA-binding NtrC family response regulator
LERLHRIAQTDVEILITGPTGVGKELYAQQAHAWSRRCSGPFVIANCSNLGADLLENEVFGHVRGAYTGAHSSGDGLASAAEGGTLFLDEVDTLALESQAKLLRFVQQKEYRRLGDTIVRRANIRLIAGCNGDLPNLVKRNLFRADLYYRLRVAPIAIPPLAERPDDIPPLLAYFIRRTAHELGTEPVTLTPRALDELMEYSWPGNVRELENLIRYLSSLQLGRPADVSDLCLIEDERDERPALWPAVTERPFKEAKEFVVDEFERGYICRALDRSNGNITKAAEASGKNRRAFFELMRKHGMNGHGREED